MEAIGCLVPELRSEKHCGHGMQLFEKMQCFYVATCLRILSCCIKFTRVLVKWQLQSRQRQLGKRAVVKAGAYIVSIDRKTTVHRLEAGEIAFFGNAYHNVHRNAFPYLTDLPVSLSLYCLYSSRAGLHNSV